MNYIEACPQKGWAFYCLSIVMLYHILSRDEEKIVQISNAGISLLQEFEGLRLKPYKCSAGVPTIGYGSTYYEDGSRVSMNDPAISVDRAKELFLLTLKKYSNAVNGICDANTTQSQFDAMVSLCYNIGTGGFLRSSVAKFHRAGNYKQASESFWMWRKASGKIVRGLVVRREKEKQLYLEEASPQKKIPLEPIKISNSDYITDWSGF